MDKAILKALWAGMYILCAVLGFMPEQEGFNRWMMIFFALLFFLPPALLVWQSWKAADARQLRFVRTVSIISLAATTLLFVLHTLSVLLVLVLPMDTALVIGDVLYGILNLVSAPMICSQFWAISLLLWAGLLWCSIAALKTLK